MRTLLVEPSSGVTTFTIKRLEVCHAMNAAAADGSRSVLADARPRPRKD
ncbi:MAG: hypothetical protein H6Q33_1162 [Deltaproteobacteria bacterium]|nr:hypothetical protein [Deltaproteobacteria bacterium]